MYSLKNEDSADHFLILSIWLNYLMDIDTSFNGMKFHIALTKVGSDEELVIWEICFIYSLGLYEKFQKFSHWWVKKVFTVEVLEKSYT